MREQQVPRNEPVQHDTLGLAPALHPLPNAAGHGRLRPEELTKLSLPPPRLRVRPCCQAPLECRHWLPWLRSRKPDVGEEDRHHCQRRGHGVVAQKHSRACRRPSLAGGLADLRVHPLARRQSRAAEPVLRCLFDASFSSAAISSVSLLSSAALAAATSGKRGADPSTSSARTKFASESARRSFWWTSLSMPVVIVAGTESWACQCQW